MARGDSRGGLSSLAKGERAADVRSSARRLLEYLLPHKRSLLFGLMWVVFSAANTAVVPAVTGWIVDTAVGLATQGSNAGDLTLPVVILLASTVLGWCSQRMQIYVVGTVGQRALFALREDVFGALQRLSVAFFERTGTGDLMSRLINDVDQVNSFLSQGFRRVLGAGLGFAFTLVGMLLVDVRLALATLAVVPLMFGASRAFGVVAKRVFRRRQEALGDVSSALAEELGGIKVTQAFVRTERTRSDFAERNAANRDASIAASAVSSAFPPVLAVISATSTALVAGYGGWLASSGAVTIGVVVAFLSYSRSFFNAVSQLSSLWAETQSALAGAERVFELIDTKPEIADAPDAFDTGRLTGHVRFEGLSFAYGDGAPVLSDIDLDVPAGMTLAIVGPTGAGKTTLVNLIARFYDPTSGRILVDGHDLRSVTLASLRANLGVVLQDPFLFSGTIMENIRYGHLDATDREVRKAAETARAADFIERLPDGYETSVGERGSLLSTGQRQLVAFARAILADPAILILDEATASVDTRTERLIQTALRTLLAERTAFVIAHRLSTVRDADRIIVIESGRIVEQGTYDELLAHGGMFAALHEAQFGDE